MGESTYKSVGTPSPTGHIWSTSPAKMSAILSHSRSDPAGMKASWSHTDGVSQERTHALHYASIPDVNHHPG